MDRTSRKVRVATELRGIVRRMQRVESLAEDLLLTDVACQVFELELKLTELLVELLELPAQRPPAPAGEDQGEQLPF